MKGINKAADALAGEGRITRDMLHGACCACAQDASKCVNDGKFKCRGWVADEKRIAAILADDGLKSPRIAPLPQAGEVEMQITVPE